MAAVPHPRIWYRLEALEEALVRQERRLGELVERQAAIKEGLKELKEAVGLAQAPREDPPARAEPAVPAGPFGRGEENSGLAPEPGAEAPVASAADSRENAGPAVEPAEGGPVAGRGRSGSGGRLAPWPVVGAGTGAASGNAGPPPPPGAGTAAAGATPPQKSAPAANSSPGPVAPLPFLGPAGREALRRAIVEGTLGNGIREAMGWLQQLQEFLDSLLKILDQVRVNLEQSGVRTLGAELPVLSRDTVEVMARMIKMPEFQRLAAGLLTQMLKDTGR
ncbi:MAG: hypothetical protein ACPLPT_03290 [Moorellales bacterium]